jgi:hypothetical protein
VIIFQENPSDASQSLFLFVAKWQEFTIKKTLIRWVPIRVFFLEKISTSKILDPISFSSILDVSSWNFFSHPKFLQFLLHQYIITLDVLLCTCINDEGNNNRKVSEQHHIVFNFMQKQQKQ